MVHISTQLLHKGSLLVCKWLLFACMLVLPVSYVFCQRLSLDDLVTLSDCPARKFENLTHKKSLMSQGMNSIKDSIIYLYAYHNYKKKDDRAHKQLLKYQLRKGQMITFQTNDSSEAQNINEDLQNGRFTGGFDSKTEDQQSLFQKGNMVISYSVKPLDSSSLFSWTIYRKDLPKAKDITYAEDLLNLDSHEFLCTVFGSSNVRKDLFYISDDKTIPCSVLFPNTKMEAVFIWQDETNYRGLGALRIGGDPKTRGSVGFERSIEQNVWQSKNGLYIGMSLQELQRISVANTTGVTYGNMTTQAKDNSKLGLILSCLNCQEAKYFRADFANVSNTMTGDDRKIYVSTMILASATE